MVGSGALNGKRVLRWAALVVLAPTLCALGIMLYLSERSSRSTALQTGAVTVADRVEVRATVQRVDAATQRVTVAVEVEPKGVYTDGSGVPVRALTLSTSSATRATITFPAGQPIPTQDLSFPMTGGTISDFPFDKYDAFIVFAAESDGHVVPVTVTVDDIDPFFHFGSKAVTEPDQVAGFEETASRARGSKFLSLFMMAAMWALALAVVAAAWILTSQNRGLVWPAMGWMAATLFALIGMRNAAPGGPPIGCVLDYAAFFWAELLVAVSVIAVAVRGVRWESANPPG